MNQELIYEKNEGTLTLRIKGGFNAHLVQTFRNILEDVESQDHSMVIDLADAEYVDSAALGLLIHVKRKLSSSNIEAISIINSNSRIFRVFQTMRFEDMFDIKKLEAR
jgi:anti-anti-sigma factor